MQLIYNGKDIASAVDIKQADITDNAGGIADSLDICFDDPEKLWPKWKPQKNDTAQVIENGFNSGLMYVDEIEQHRGSYIIRALSIPQEAKTPNTKAWENVRFLEFAGELAGRNGFTLQTYGIENHFYQRVDQVDTADFEFLKYRCILEGYGLKLTDRKAVIYDERYMESQNASKDIFVEDFDGKYRFKSTSTKIYGSCRLSYGGTEFDFKPSTGSKGPVKKHGDIYITSQGEAERFARNLLRFYNKHENTGNFMVQLDTGLAGGNVISVIGSGLADGKYFCEQVIHSLVSKRTSFKVRKPLEGY